MTRPRLFPASAIRLFQVSAPDVTRRGAFSNHWSVLMATRGSNSSTRFGKQGGTSNKPPNPKCGDGWATHPVGTDVDMSCYVLAKLINKVRIMKLTTQIRYCLIV